uniref:pre-mRNA 3'-end-processing factor FIP1-like n=1 Tax=Oncorhynchus gorbuscha TaxID=8017 RepID=UPI001EAEEB62|nr:pre-mRNA 3'-end-processing factor FIP1-like [Oncorhynchus gorbuscha]
METFEEKPWRNQVTGHWGRGHWGGVTGGGVTGGGVTVGTLEEKPWRKPGTGYCGRGYCGRGYCGAGLLWAGVAVGGGCCGAGSLWCGVAVVRGRCGAGSLWCGVAVVRGRCGIFEEKPWRKPGADLSDYFNYGFNEDTWKGYCDKQKRLRMGLEVVNISSTTSKITVQQGRTGNEKEVSLPIHTSKPDFPTPASIYKTSMNMNTTRISPPQWTAPPVQDMSYYTKTSGTIDVIGGGTATISRVEGRRRHNLEGNNIQVISEHSSSDAEQNSNKMPPFFPPGPLPQTSLLPHSFPLLPTSARLPPLIPPTK